MKTKDIFSPVILIGLVVAFAVFSLLVWFSRGKNARYIKNKYKLGGMILSLSFFATGCSTIVPPEVTCYVSVPPPNMIYINYNNNDSIPWGDTIQVNIWEPTYSYYSYCLTETSTNKIIKEEILQRNDTLDNAFYIQFNDINTVFTGAAHLQFFGESSAEIKKSEELKSLYITFYAKKEE